MVKNNDLAPRIVFSESELTLEAFTNQYLRFGYKSYVREERKSWEKMKKRRNELKYAGFSLLFTHPFGRVSEPARLPTCGTSRESFTDMLSAPHLDMKGTQGLLSDPSRHLNVPIRTSTRNWTYCPNHPDTLMSHSDTRWTGTYCLIRPDMLTSRPDA
jgi:hypothetical protein